MLDVGTKRGALELNLIPGATRQIGQWGRNDRGLPDGLIVVAGGHAEVACDCQRSHALELEPGPVVCEVACDSNGWIDSSRWATVDACDRCGGLNLQD